MARDKKVTQKQSDKKGPPLVFDPKDRVQFIKGFKKRKQERKDHAKQAASEKERQVRIALRRKRKEVIASRQQTQTSQIGDTSVSVDEETDSAPI